MNPWGRMLFILLLIASVSLATGLHYSNARQLYEDRDKHWQAPAEQAARKNPVAVTPQSIVQGKNLYRENCAECHGKDGGGDGPLASQILTRPADLKKISSHNPDGDLAWKIKKGRDDMPGWEGVLSEREIWHIVHFLKTLGGK